MKILILCLTLCLFIITACNILPGNSNIREVRVDAIHQKCDIDSDCIEVRTKCDHCECLGTPVNKEFKQIYSDRYKSLCTIYLVPVCDVVCTPESIRCMNNSCAFVKEQILESDIDNCTDESECIIVSFSHCCGSTKRAISQKYLAEYNQHLEWQKFDNPETCAVIGLCPDDSNVTEATCQNSKCIKKY